MDKPNSTPSIISSPSMRHQYARSTPNTPLHLSDSQESSRPQPPSRQHSRSCTAALPGYHPQQHQQQQQQLNAYSCEAYPRWLTTPTLDAPPDPGYIPMDEASNNLHCDHSNSANCSTHSSGSVAQWFALETTAEDRLSWSIITEELKDLFHELFYFLKNRHWKKKLLTVAVVVASGLVFYDLMFGHYIKEWIDAFLIWMTDYPTAAEFVFMGIYVLSTIFFIPPTVMLLGAGWAFAEAWGSIWRGVGAAAVCCFLGSVIGALLSFVRSRYMMRDLIELFAKRYPIVKAADSALKRDGLRIMFLLRLCPLIPFHGLNYLGGITGVSWETFLFSLIGIIPYQILVITMGATAGQLHHSVKESAKYASDDDEYQYGHHAYDDDTMNEGDDIVAAMQQKNLQNLILLIMCCVGLATFIIAMILTFRFTKKELQKELKIGEGDMQSYIKTVRRMSMIDLYDDDSYRNATIETDEGLEVIKAASKAFSVEDVDDDAGPGFLKTSASF